MAKREAKEILPTMKPNDHPEDELSLAFEEKQVSITKVSDVQSKDFGEKCIVTVEDEEGMKFNIFVNNSSMANLIEAFGDDDKGWIGKFVDIKREKNDKFKNKMIVLYPVK